MAKPKNYKNYLLMLKPEDAEWIIPWLKAQANQQKYLRELIKKDYKKRTGYEPKINTNPNYYSAPWKKIGPAKYQKWKPVYPRLIDGNMTTQYMCGYCKETSLEASKYCPHCGKLMIKEKSDDK